mgnify:CR=1 FL=1
MPDNSTISDQDCKKLALKIKNDIFKPVNTNKITVFLCGADINDKERLRGRIADAMKDKWYSYLFDIVYPEDIFDELLYSPKSKDLLSLENLLADSVDAVVVIPESPGSFTELGAFANNSKLRKKMICIIENRYKKNRSFINQGPIKLLKKANKSAVIFMNPENIETGVDKLRTALKSLPKNSLKTKKSLNLLQLDSFLLPTTYLLEPVSKTVLSRIVSYATKDSSNSYQMTTAALTTLTKKRQVELTKSGYRLTKFGVKSFFNLVQTKKRVKLQKEKNAIDDLRLEILNLKFRGKSLTI